MAIRRMFSKRVIESARFLKMPLSSQALYFHLGMKADDDGIVEAYPVVKMVGASEDDLKVLVSKGLVQVLTEDLVSYITDWTENNQIRADRKIDSIYKDLLLQINPEVKLIEKRPRADVLKRQMTDDGQPMDVQWTTNGQPMDGIGKDRVVEDRLGEGRLEEDRTVKDKTGKKKESVRFIPPTVEEVEDFIFQEGLSIDAEEFFNYYASQKWQKANGRPLSDWQAAARYWERKRKDKPVQSKTAKELHGFYEMADEWGAERSGS